MTFEERNEIFSKECISTHDLMKLFDISTSKASALMGNIKLKSNMLNVRGKCHVLDYCKYFGIKADRRYFGDWTSDDYSAALQREDTVPHIFISPR